MSKILLSIFILTSQLLISYETELIVIDAHSMEVIAEEGSHINTRYSPCSTFKIPLSLMGFDAQILEDEDHPVLSYDGLASLTLDAWHGSHTPASWMRNSVVWYSQALTQSLGLASFDNYVQLLEYGNQDTSGGLTECWLQSTLAISPLEQVLFLRKLYLEELPVSKKAHQLTKKLLLIEETPDRTLYGKTGTGDTSAWFVGYVVDQQRTLIFALYMHNIERVPTRAERIECLKAKLPSYKKEFKFPW